jgi:pyruvate formate-lyase activating enzyme-like uncharacterized protein
LLSKTIERRKYFYPRMHPPPMVKNLPLGSLVSGALPEGCKLCARGSKLVLLVTGLCPAACYYCPLSDAKSDRDVTFADEMRVRRWTDIVEEAEAIGAEGAVHPRA